MLGLDRLRLGIEAIVEALVRPRIDYLALYPSTVISQDDAGRLDLLPDSELVRGQGLSGIPLRMGLPGFTATVEQGSRVLLGFEEGDPSKPYACLWEPTDGTDVAELCFDGGDEKVARTGDSAGELYVDVVTTAPIPLVYYRSPRGVTGIWAPVMSGGPPTPLTVGTPVVIDEGSDKLLA